MSTPAAPPERRKIAYRPAVDGVRYSFISQGTTAVSALRSGEIDWTDAMPAQQLSILRRDDTLDVGTVVANDYWYVTMNFDAPPFEQYLSYLGGLLRGDLGVSYQQHRPVWDMIAEQLGATVALSLTALATGSIGTIARA